MEFKTFLASKKVEFIHLFYFLHLSQSEKIHPVFLIFVNNRTSLNTSTHLRGFHLKAWAQKHRLPYI